MILDTLANVGCYTGLSEHFAKAFSYLQTHDLTKIDFGRYDIDGDDVYIMIQHCDLKPWDEGKWEAHRRYADIQIVIKGEERIGYRIEGTPIICDAYDTEKDVLFYEESAGDSAVLSAGDFLVLFPQDAHRPCIQATKTCNTVRKAVVKVRI